QPAAYMKICALLVPREMKVERSGGVKAMTEEQIVDAIAAIEGFLARRSGETAKVIEGEAEVVPSLPAPARPTRASWSGRSGSVPPKVLEPVGRQFGVPDGVLNILMPEVVLQGPRVVAIVGELEPAGMAEHVGVDREWHLGGLPEWARRARKRIR